MPSASGTFEVTPGGEDTLHESGDGPKLTHATGTQRFTGDLQADGAVDWLMCYLPDRSATFVGLQTDRRFARRAERDVRDARRREP